MIEYIGVEYTRLALFELKPILWFVKVIGMPRRYFLIEQEQIAYLKTIPQSTFEI